MNELEQLLNVQLSGFLTPTTLVLAVFFVIPGFIAMKVYDLAIAAERRNFGNSLIEVVSFSLINFLFWAWLPLAFDVSALTRDRPILTYLLTLLIVVISPILLAIVARKLLDSRVLRSVILDPSPTGWDGFFRKRESCWMLFRLKDEQGTIVGGYFGSDSVASSHPNKQQIYVEELWNVDQNTHDFLHEVPRTRGGIISAEECYFIEMFRD